MMIPIPQENVYLVHLQYSISFQIRNFLLNAYLTDVQGNDSNAGVIVAYWKLRYLVLLAKKFVSLKTNVCLPDCINCSLIQRI